MSFLRKQFGFWRIFLYFLIFTAFYAVLIFKFLLSNFTLPTGVGVLSNAALFSYTVFYSGGIFLLIYFMLIWGISTGFILGLCQFRRSVKGVLSATFIGTLIAGVSFYVILNDISLYFCLFHGALCGDYVCFLSFYGAGTDSSHATHCECLATGRLVCRRLLSS